VKLDYKNICDVCHYSKQHKLPFQKRTSHTLKLFWFNTCWYTRSNWLFYTWAQVFSHNYRLPL